MKDWQIDLQRQWYTSCYEAGLINISDDKCYQLLAYVYVYGGESEQMTMDGKISSAILYAEKRLNIGSGQIPDQELIPILKICYCIY
jgi:hypothetical protein